jgi:RNA polymerase sigma-70 factor (ECF subfamily)
VTKPDRGAEEAGHRPDEAVLGDPVLLQEVRQRKPDALGRVFDAAFPYIYGIAFRLSGNRAVAEDITQDVFVKFHRSADRVDPSRHLKPWLTTITLNTCRDLLRRRTRRAEESLDPGVIDAIGHTAETPEYVLVQRERQHLLDMAMQALDERHREIVVLHVFSGLPHEESAGILGITPAAARKRYSRALEKLRAYVRKREP